MDSFEDYDLTSLGEPVQVAAKVKDGFRTGVIALTETRLAYLRKNKDQTIIHRVSDRDAITEVRRKKSWGQWWLEFKDGSKLVMYQENGDEFEPFIEPLNRSVEENQTKDIEAKTTELETIVGEPIQYMCKAKDSGDWIGGTIALTSTRLVYVRLNKGKPFVKNQIPLDSITSVQLGKNIIEGLHVRFGDEEVSYGPMGEPLDVFEPIFETLLPIATHNEEIAARVRAEAAERAVKLQLREAEKRSRAEAEIIRPKMVTVSAPTSTNNGGFSEQRGGTWKRWGCISVIVVVALLVLFLVCSTNDGYDCNREGDRPFTWDADGVDRVLEYTERCGN